MARLWSPPSSSRPCRSGDGGPDPHTLPQGDASDLPLLRAAMDEFRRCWAGDAPSAKWKLERDASGVTGLHVVEDFLGPSEVEALRTVHGAHRAWTQYTYGTQGARGELASVVQRIDFGPDDASKGLQPEGVVGGAPMWRLGEMRAEIVAAVGARLRHVFGAASLWAGTAPDTLQLTRMGVQQELANHYDKRDKWKEGIASVAWSELPCEEDLRGEPWVLNMELGTAKDRKVVTRTMPPGSAYVLMGTAQGITKFCERRSVGHNRCNCCWTHGVQLAGSIARQSMTLRCLAESADMDETSDEEEEGEGEGEEEGEEDEGEEDEGEEEEGEDEEGEEEEPSESEDDRPLSTRKKG